MDDKVQLSKVRQGWPEIEALKTQLLRRVTVEEGIRQYLALQAEFEPQLLASEPFSASSATTPGAVAGAAAHVESQKWSRDGESCPPQLLEDVTPLHADPDEALRRSGVAFFLDAAGVRITVMLAETSFDATVIGRARPTEFQPGLAARLCSAEDLIICKSVSLRSQDRLDVEGIIRRQGDRLDDRYVEDWLRRFQQALDDSTRLAEYRRLRQRTA